MNSDKLQSYFAGKVVCVTGGTDGIGKALVQKCLALGAFVSTCGRTRQKLEALSAELVSDKLLCVQADVGVYEDCEKFINQTIQQFSKIDILINNAGMSMRSLLKDCSIEVFKKIMDINYFGTLYCTKLALQSIVQQKGTIVGISSIAGYRGLPGRSGYSASKFAVNGWMEAIRTELMEDDVNVLWVAPGFTKSNIRNAALNANANSHGETPIDEEELMTSEECADHILQAIVKRKRTLVLTFTGKRTVFMNKFFPAWTDKLTHKFFFKDGKLIK